MMSRSIILALLVVAGLSSGFSQLKSQAEPSASRSLIHPQTSISNFLGLLNPENFQMRHNFSFSYLAGGGVGMSLASYTNSMFYRLADPLHLRMDITLQGSPFGQYGGLQQNQFNQLYISRAELNYQPWKDTYITLQYRQLPYGLYNNFYDPLLYRGDIFGRDQ